MKTFLTRRGRRSLQITGSRVHAWNAKSDRSERTNMFEFCGIQPMSLGSFESSREVSAQNDVCLFSAVTCKSFVVVQWIWIVTNRRSVVVTSSLMGLTQPQERMAIAAGWHLQLFWLYLYINTTGWFAKYASITFVISLHRLWGHCISHNNVYIAQAFTHGTGKMSSITRAELTKEGKKNNDVLRSH